MRWAATPQVDGRGDSMMARIVRGTLGVIRILWGVGNDRGGWPLMAGIREDHREPRTKNKGDG